MTRSPITRREARMRFPGEISPRQARRRANAIREEFLRELAAALDRDVLFVERPRLIAWRSAQGRVEHARLEPYYLPDRRDPARPLILRASINYGGPADWKPILKRVGWEDRVRADRWWKMELSMLPGEVLDYVPWLASVVGAHEHNDAARVIEPPHPTRFWQVEHLDRDYAWSEAAWDRAELYDELCPMGTRRRLWARRPPGEQGVGP